MTTTHRSRRSDAALVRLKQAVLDEHLARKLSVAQAAGLLAMHPKAFLRLKGRYTLCGIAALWPKKPGPKSGSRTSANRTPTETEALVVSISRQHPFAGPIPLAREIARLYGVRLHPTTVWRILCRCSDRYEPTRKRWKHPAKLYALEEPGIEAQMDACYPFGRSRDLAVFDAVDDCSRFLGAQAYAAEDLPSAKTFIRHLVKTSPFRIRALRLDNRFHGPALVAYAARFRIKLIFNEPYHPEQNGKIERYHRTFKREAVWRTFSFYDPMPTIRYKLALWVNHYNHERPHGGLAMHGMTPAEKLASVYLSKSLTYSQAVTGSLQQYKTGLLPCLQVTLYQITTKSAL